MEVYSFTWWIQHNPVCPISLFYHLSYKKDGEDQTKEREAKAAYRILLCLCSMCNSHSLDLSSEMNKNGPNEQLLDIWETGCRCWYCLHIFDSPQNQNEWAKIGDFSNSTMVQKEKFCAFVQPSWMIEIQKQTSKMMKQIIWCKLFRWGTAGIQRILYFHMISCVWSWSKTCGIYTIIYL
jgi:hypothetical protein